VGANPVRETLSPGGLGKGIAAGAQDGDKDLSLFDLARMGENHRNSLACIIQEHFFPGPVFLTHNQVKLSRPFPVFLAEPTVLVPFRIALLVLLPQEEQRHVFAFEFLVDFFPLGHGAR